ncbi:MAG: DUF58 domain-containing protein [Planctomycetia bacterium]|nr:DUF58 domain-containing protein [Planctomycetia bacterium]
MNRHRRTTLFRDGLVFLVLTAVIFAGAVIREVNLLLLFGSLLFCLFVLDWISGRRCLRHLKVTRNLPAEIYAGDSFLVSIALDNTMRSRSCWSILVEDRIQPLDETHREQKGLKDIVGWQPICYFPYLVSGQSMVKTYAGRIGVRGRYHTGPVYVTTRFPLGFFRNGYCAGQENEFLVFPKLGVLTSEWFRQHELMTQDRPSREQRLSRCSDELQGVRKWQSGDVRKWIHWRASAKHREIFVRQFQEFRQQDSLIILDQYQTDTQENDAFDNFELAISFCAALTKYFSQSAFGDFHFICSESETVYGGRTGRALSLGIMEQLATLTTAAEDHLANVLKRLPEQCGFDTNVVLVTTSPIDLSTSPRVAELRADPRINQFLSRIQVVDTSNPKFDRWYQV